MCFQNFSSWPHPLKRPLYVSAFYGYLVHCKFSIVYGGRELRLKIFKFVGIIFVIFFKNFVLFLIFLFRIKASESKICH